MGTIFHHSSFLLSSSSFDLSNHTLINEENSDTNQLLHLFIFIAVWIVLITTIVFGSTGNILVLYVYVSRSDNKTCTFFIKMLAIVDLIICLVLAPLELYQTTTGIRNEILCKFYGFLNTHVLYSTLLITTIAFDRYFCICWPLYKIVTIRRARVMVTICGILSSLFAIVPMSEYSTIEHVLQLHNNHSEQLSLGTPYDEYESPVYTHVENIQTSLSKLPFTLGNATNVKCSPRFSLHLHLSNFLILYRTFHSTIFTLCIVLVFILYLFIYNAIYQRRRTRAKRFSTYRKVLQSYLINNEKDRKRIHRHSFFTYVCCYCCHKIHLKSSRDLILHQSLDQQQKKKYSPHEKSAMEKRRPEQIVLEINGARGKRYSAVSMTSMTYLTSGVWDETSSTSLIRSRINSIAATTYCGMEHSSTSRPSTSTEDSFDQTNKSTTLNNTLAQLRPVIASNSTYLTVPGQQLTLPSSSTDTTNREHHFNDTELPGNTSPGTNLLHPTIARKPSNTLSIRQHLSEVPVHPRKVSFITSIGAADRCIIEDLPSTNQQYNSTSSPLNQSLTIHINHHHSLSPPTTMDPIRNSISSTRRGSIFDCETKRIFERQQKQERSANIRTTLTLFVVTATFILMYLPSIIITLFNIKPHEFREVFFLLYYINSACNPLVYSFFNVNFRNDIRRIYECQKREYLARQY